MNRIIRRLQRLGDKERRVACIRHGERNPIPRGEFGHEVTLNGAGIAAAVEFGVELGDLRVEALYASPILRCVQTAELIREGLGRDVPIFKREELGFPGLHILNAESAGQELMKRGMRPLYDDYVQNREIAGFSDKPRLKNALLRFFRETAEKNRGISLYITHDLLIALFENACFNKIYGADEWVDYLDGFTL